MPRRPSANLFGLLSRLKMLIDIRVYCVKGCIQYFTGCWFMRKAEDRVIALLEMYLRVITKLFNEQVTCACRQIVDDP